MRSSLGKQVLTMGFWSQIACYLAGSDDHIPVASEVQRAPDVR